MAAVRKFLTCLLAAALCLGLLLPTTASAASIYFTAVNETVAVLNAETMPVYSGGVMYVPYTVFDGSTTGIDLGLYTSYSRSSSTVTLFNLRQMLVFDLSAGTCRNDMTGEYYSARAIVRNNCPYVPVEMVCDFFGLTYTLNRLSYVENGWLVRIRSSAAVLDDETFIDAAQTRINTRLREYNQSISPQNPTDPPTPSVTPDPGTEQDEEDSTSTVRTYLAFLCEDREGLSEILDTMDGYGQKGLFLLSSQVLQQEDDLLRRIVGSGHSIGLLAQGADLGETLDLLTEGSLILERKLHIRPTIACVPDSQMNAVEEEGWVCWNETLRLAPSDTVGANTFASNTAHQLSGRTRTTYLTLEGGDNAARVLSSLLRRLENENFVVSIPMETRL